MTDISREAVERLSSGMEMTARVSDASVHTCEELEQGARTLRALRDALDEAHRAGWDDAIEAAAACADSWQSNGEILLRAGEMTPDELRTARAVAAGIYRATHALPYKPQEDMSDG